MFVSVNIDPKFLLKAPHIYYGKVPWAPTWLKTALYPGLLFNRNCLITVD